MIQATTGTCPDANVLGRLLEGLVDTDERGVVEAHLDACESCARLVAELARFAPRPGDSRAPVIDRVAASGAAEALEPGATIGRFTLLERLGIGGMGVVWAAYDPELDRRIALKFARSALGDGDRVARLGREAKALARVNHPNVVAVHDIGFDAGRMYIAQELVGGRQLGAWLTAQPRSCDEIVAVFAQAARGLAAAHAAGIVHRDFKPRNVLVGDDGRVRVVDFGVACPIGTAAAGGACAAAVDPRLTSTGFAVGTPLYMSPEQRKGEPCDARSDQFSFCMSLAEALYGELPGAREGEVDLRLPPNPKVPARLRAAMARGLSRDRGARFPTMEALLAVLEREPPRLTAPVRSGS